MKGITPLSIINYCNGIYRGDSSILNTEVTMITTDSRKYEEGCLFIPIKGERFDGHDFIPRMLSSGALVCLTEDEKYIDGYNCIYVESTLEAIKIIASEYLKILGTKVISVTGSVGKTSTKEMIHSVLSTGFKTLKTLGNFNNNLGLPLTIFRLREEDEIAVLEMGINHFGEMTELSSIAPPDVSVITNIGECHLEFLGDRNGVLKAKTEVFKNLRPGGKVILNGEDDKLITVKDVNGVEPLFYGFSDRFAVYADDITENGIYGTECVIHAFGDEERVSIPIPGRHMILNALAAAACGIVFGLSLKDIKKGIESSEGVAGRLNIINTGRITVIDDCYNANPVSMKAALTILAKAEGRKVAVLGDMGELGDNSVNYHREVGAFAAVKSDILVAIGEKAEYMAEAAMLTADKGSVLKFKDAEEFNKNAASVLRDGDTVLVKASHAMEFEKIIQHLRSL